MDPRVFEYLLGGFEYNKCEMDHKAYHNCRGGIETDWQEEREGDGGGEMSKCLSRTLGVGRGPITVPRAGAAGIG